MHAPFTQCHVNDRFYLTAVDDSIVLYRSSDCLIQFIGPLSQSRYSALLNALFFRGVYPSRGSIGVQWIYWDLPGCGRLSS